MVVWSTACQIIHLKFKIWFALIVHISGQAFISTSFSYFAVIYNRSSFWLLFICTLVLRLLYPKFIIFPSHGTILLRDERTNTHDRVLSNDLSAQAVKMIILCI